MSDGLYVTVEGIDGSGKSTLVERLAGRLGCVTTAEPDDGMWTGEAVRKATREDTAVTTDVLLFAADRSEHLARTVAPALADGRMVVSDRGHDSTYAYQAPRLADAAGPGWTRHDAREWLDSMYGHWNVEPDLTLWIDTPVPVAAERLSGDEKWTDTAFLTQTRKQYHEIMKRNPERVERIDGSDGEQEVADVAERLIRGR